MIQLNKDIAALKRGKTRGITPTRRARGQELSPNWVFILLLGAMFPDMPLTAQEAAEALGICVDHTRRLIREKKIPATRRCNRHVLKISDVLEARLGVLGEKGTSANNGNKNTVDKIDNIKEVRDA